MEIDYDTLDETVLALLYLTTFKMGRSIRAWKSHDWETLDRLHTKGMISNPRSKAKSVMLTEEGETLSKEYFIKYFDMSE